MRITLHRAGRNRTMSQSLTRQPHSAIHVDERDWETLRWPGQWSKMLFHPRAGAPTDPNAGLVRYDAGAHHPLHKHDFAQVWYILEGTFTIGEATYGPGTMLYYPDPHFQPPLITETGGPPPSCPCLSAPTTASAPCVRRPPLGSRRPDRHD